MMRAVAEDVLGLSFQCFTDPLNVDYPECLHDKQTIFTTRGRVYGYHPNGVDAYSMLHIVGSQFPYGPTMSGQQPSAINIFELIVGSTSLIPAVAEHWHEFVNERDYARAMALADFMFSSVRHTTYNGVPWTAISIWQLAIAEGFSAEQLQFAIDWEGQTTPDFIHMTVAVFMQEELREIALSAAPLRGTPLLVTPMAKVQSVYRRVGMQSLVDGLLDAVVAAGVRLFYDTRVTGVQRVSDDPRVMSVALKSGHQVRTGNVFLNIPKNELIALGTSSEPLRSAGVQFRQALSRLSQLSMSKMYCFWNEAWWISKLGLTKGIFRTAEETLYVGRYHDGDVICTDSSDLTTCRGSLLVSYIGGSTTGAQSAINIRAYNDDINTPWTSGSYVHRLVQGNMTRHEQMHFDEIHRQLRKSHASTFTAFGLDVQRDLPDAAGCIFSDWVGSGIYLEHGPRDGDDNPSASFMRPAPGLNLSLVNEAWGESHGWAESSLRSAERALYHLHDIGKPVWMDTPFHTSVVVKYNMG